MTPTSDLEKKMELGREIVSVLVPTGKQVKCTYYILYNWTRVHDCNIVKDQCQ